ncbi:DUF4240 domain-containing protein [Streptomyces qinzhouensis]|uniref:DUF4240 domain-containing protein n=1 Tax=Streptomyces qinzhouensis TaxID=2599401 RepID=A0A5B8II39_9ACTN|nr:DUF4240 domain-containing protein [Streptomyces qinzhouensis]QDY77982.1 DUF4240 domain-containing protein [Streptomyces qinzhouensis]
MDEKTFWALMDALSRRPGDRTERLSGLHEELLRLPATAVVEFQAHLEAACEAVALDALLRAVMRIEGGLCSDDGFDYFALWLVAQGRGTYEAVLADPDVLADVAEVRALAGRDVREWRDDEWPEWEELDYVAQDVFEELTGAEGDAFLEALEALQPEWPEPEPASASERAARPTTPRLDALFPMPVRDGRPR